MAIDIDKREIKRLPVQAYEAVRNDLRSGDLVFCSGSYFFWRNEAVAMQARIL